MNKTKKITLSGIFAALIFLATAYLLHIPTGTGYVHLGDTFIFLAACILPLHYAMMAAVIGAGLADLVSGAVIWIIPTIIIKPLMVLIFFKKQKNIINKRNIIVAIIACFIGIIGYLIAEIILFMDIRVAILGIPMGLIQPIGSFIGFIIIGKIIDKIKQI